MFTSSQSSSPTPSSLCRGRAGAGVQSPGSRYGVHPREHIFGAPHSLSPKESRGDCFHFKFLESPGLFGTWRVTPNFQPHEKGVGGELGTGCGRYGSVLALALTGRGLSAAQAPFWGAEGDGREVAPRARGQSVELSVSGGALAETKRQVQPDSCQV